MAEKQTEDPSYTYSLQGSGTESDPYQISSAMDLAYISKIVSSSSANSLAKNKYFSFSNDIVMNDGKFIENVETGQIEYHQGNSGELICFDPCSTYNREASFVNCSFFGNGHKIIGFFGSAFASSFSNCIINDLHFKNVYCNNQAGNASYHALFANSITNATVENCSTDGWIDGVNGCGIVYEARNSNFLNCNNYTKNIAANSRTWGIGAIVGKGYSCILDGCINYGEFPNKTKANWYFCGGIIGSASSDTIIRNCINKGDLIKEGGDIRTGGIANQGGNIINCENYGIALSGIACEGAVSITNSINYADCSNGIGGWAYGSITLVENCQNYGECNYGIGYVKTVRNCKNYKLKSSGGTGIGTATTIENCINYANVEDGSSFTGIGSGTTISNCTNYGNANISGSACGIGNANNITDCVNYGNLIGKKGCGGIMLSLSKNTTIANCINHGVLTTEGGYGVGGILASATYVQFSIYIINCANNGNLYKGRAGGILGQAISTNAYIKNCVNNGNISGTAARGGLVGYVQDNTTIRIKNCMNNGNVIKQSGSYLPGIFVGNNCNGTVYLTNCVSRGDVVSGSASLIGTNEYNYKNYIDNVIIQGKANGVAFKKYWGSDFSAFFMKYKTGYIGLKALESAGVYMYAIPDEEYLQRRGFEKIG